MVVSIRELGNITLSATTLCSSTYNMAPIQDIDMAIDSVNDLFTGDKVKDCPLALSVHKSRSLLIFSSKSDKEYDICVKRDSDRMDENKPVSSIGNSQDKYMTKKKKKDQVSKVADNTDNMCHQYVSVKDLASNLPSGSNMFKIQLNYDVNQAIDPESWDSDFHAVSLHRSMEHLASDVKNIKESFCRMGNYIKDKSVNANPNDVKDLDGIGKVVWEFLSVVYDLHWDGLYMDNSKTSFRNKVKSKFNPQVP